MTEQTILRASKILGTVGWVILVIAILFTIEIGFIFATLSIALWFAQFNSDPGIVFFFMRLHNFLFQLAFIVFLLSTITYVVYVFMKSSRERREKFEAMRSQSFQELKDHILDALEESPEFKKHKARKGRRSR